MIIECQSLIFSCCLRGRGMCGGGKLAEFVAYHVFSYINGDKFVTVMNCECMANEFGGDHRCAAPGLDDILFAGSFHVGHFLLELNADEGTFFNERLIFA